MAEPNILSNMGSFFKVPRLAFSISITSPQSQRTNRPEEWGNCSLENFTIKGNCLVLSLRTRHTSLGSYKNNYQVISKGYYFFFKIQTPTLRMTLACISVGGSCCSGKSETLGVETEQPCSRCLAFPRPQFPQPYTEEARSPCLSHWL